MKLTYTGQKAQPFRLYFNVKFYTITPGQPFEVEKDKDVRWFLRTGLFEQTSAELKADTKIDVPVQDESESRDPDTKPERKPRRKNGRKSGRHSV